MQLSPINSLSTSKDTKKTQSTSSSVSATSTCSLPIIFAGNTDETPLTLVSNQAISTSEYSIHSLDQASTILNSQSQHEYNQRNFWQVFHGNVTEDLFKEKILDYIKNNWGLDSSLKQNINNPMLKTRIDIQYQSLVDMLFQLKFIHFIDLIITDMFNFIQTENQISATDHLNELELIIAKHDVKKEISAKLSFMFNTLYKNYFNCKNEVLSQDTQVKLIPSFVNELELAEEENLKAKIDPCLYTTTLSKIECLLTEEINLDSKNPNENDEINSIIQSNILSLNMSSDSFATLDTGMFDMLDIDMLDTDMLDMHSHSLVAGMQDTDMLDMHSHPLAAGMQDADTTVDTTDINSYSLVAGMQDADTTVDTTDINSYSLVAGMQDTNTTVDTTDINSYSLIAGMQDANMADMCSHSSVALQEDISLKEQTFIQLAGSYDLISIAYINEPQRNDIEAELKDSDLRTITNINTGALQESSKSPDELMLKSFLVNIFDEDLEKHEQALFKACKENDPLKEEYLALTMSALQIKKTAQQIKTRIAQLSCLNPEVSYTNRHLSKLKNLFCKHLANMLMNFSNYHRLIEKLQPQQTQTTISISQMKKINKEIIDEIQEAKKKLANSKKKYKNAINKSRVTKTKVVQEAPWYLTERRAIEILKSKFTNLSIAQIREIILSTQITQIENNEAPENTLEELQESIISDEATKLEFLLANIFTVPFYCEEQILFKVYKEKHPLKNNFLMLITSALKAKKSCLKTKSRIAQLTQLKQKENYDIRAAKMIETYLCRDLTELLENSSSYYRFMEELKPLEIQITDKISARKMKKINKILVDQVRALQNKIIFVQRYYDAILNDKKITEDQVMQNIPIHLTQKKVIETIKERFKNLSDNKINEIITSSKIIPQIEDTKSTGNITNSLEQRSESEEAAILKFLIINMFKNNFHYNEQTLFNAYIQDVDSKEDILALSISAMQAQRACLKIKTRIIQLTNLAQKENSRSSDVSTEKKFLYRDLTELFTSSSNYNQLIDKLQLPKTQTQKQAQPSKKSSKYTTRTQMKTIAAIDEDLAELIRRKKNQLRVTQRYFYSTVQNKQATENQIIQNTLLYLTEQKAIRTFKAKFTSLTEDKIKETITNTVLLFAENQANEAADASSTKQLRQELRNDDWSINLVPAAKKMCTRKSQASASLPKIPKKTASSSQANVLKFSTEALTAREPSQSAEIHFPSQSVELTPVQEEMTCVEASQTNTVSTVPPFSTLIFQLFEQENLSEDLDIPAIEPAENE